VAAATLPARPKRAGKVAAATVAALAFASSARR